ncbi:hypothetical protein [Frankia sp. CiP1_Cm_nod2]|uniref:hypothetical protein n=1 Tax=Frankia sp. CiP1_Cm_nod2 TaxID=2897161 RepID=UPI0020240783
MARPPASPPRPHAAAGTNADRRALIQLRRRRLFVLLAMILVTALLAGLLGGVWIAVQILADAAVVSYVVHLRRAAQADRRLRASRFALDRRIAAERAVRYGYRMPGPGAAGTGLGGGVGGDAGEPWVSGSEPFRLSDQAVARPGAPAGRGTPRDDLAMANAQTVDLSRSAAAATARITAAGGSPRGQILEGAVIDGTAVDRSVDDGSVADAPAAGNVAVTDADLDAVTDADLDGFADADGSADAAETDGAPDLGQAPGPVGGARPAARAAGRPNTSRPGRVQVNPPGTHGGLTAGPASTGPASTPAPGPQQPASGSDDPGEADELLRRHAVGS